MRHQSESQTADIADYYDLHAGPKFKKSRFHSRGPAIRRLNKNNDRPAADRRYAEWPLMPARKKPIDTIYQDENF